MRSMYRKQVLQRVQNQVGERDFAKSSARTIAASAHCISRIAYANYALYRLCIAINRMCVHSLTIYRIHWVFEESRTHEK